MARWSFCAFAEGVVETLSKLVPVWIHQDTFCDDKTCVLIWRSGCGCQPSALARLRSENFDDVIKSAEKNAFVSW